MAADAIYAVPVILIIYGLVAAVPRLLEVEVIRVVVPPVVLIVAVLGSISVHHQPDAGGRVGCGAMLLSAIKLLSAANRLGLRQPYRPQHPAVDGGFDRGMLLVKANFLDGGQSQVLAGVLPPPSRACSTSSQSSA